MDSQFGRLVWSLSLGAFLAAATTAIAADPAPAKIASVEELPGLCRAAKGQFRPLAQADMEQAKVKLLEALGRLDQRLTQAGPSGDGWRKYLQWESLQSELQRPQAPDVAALTNIYKRYAADKEGLDLVWFLDVQQAPAQLSGHFQGHRQSGNQGVVRTVARVAGGTFAGLCRQTRHGGCSSDQRIAPLAYRRGPSTRTRARFSTTMFCRTWWLRCRT